MNVLDGIQLCRGQFASCKSSSYYCGIVYDSGIMWRDQLVLKFLREGHHSVETIWWMMWMAVERQHPVEWSLKEECRLVELSLRERQPAVEGL